MFVVIEIKDNKDGTAEVITNYYENRAQADNKYYAVLDTAAVSTVPIHSATMLTSEGYYVKSECFIHEKTGEE